MYVDYLRTKLAETPMPLSENQKKYFETFYRNLLDGIEYYRRLYSDFEEKLEVLKKNILSELEEIRIQLEEYSLADA